MYTKTLRAYRIYRQVRNDRSNGFPSSDTFIPVSPREIFKKNTWWQFVGLFWNIFDIHEHVWQQLMLGLLKDFVTLNTQMICLFWHRQALSHCQGPWTNESAFSWINGEKLEKDWPGWGGTSWVKMKNTVDGSEIRRENQLVDIR